MNLFNNTLFLTVKTPSSGTYAVNYLFSRRQFNYTEIEYSIFGTVSSVTGLIGETCQQ